MSKDKNKAAAETHAQKPAGAAAAGDFQLPDMSDWEEEQIGFAPYWTPEEGKFFLGTPIGKDARDPEFVRYTFRAAMPMTVHRGANREREEVQIKAGDVFSMSVYYQLEDLFDFYMVSGLEPVCRVEALEEVPTKKTGQTCWRFSVKTSKEDRKQIDAVRAKLLAEAVAAKKARINGLPGKQELLDSKGAPLPAGAGAS